MKQGDSRQDPSAIRQAVREAYGRRTEGGCCGSSSAPEAGSSPEEHARRIGYEVDELQSVPEGANLGLGCGAPLRGAEVQPGETVLDLGSGAGFDAFIAARDVGPSGRVIGVDMTPEMVEKARANAGRAGISNVEFHLGLIESLPLADDSVELVISNCVINLSPDKPAVFREAFRVLRPGGRMAVSDIVLTAPLPERIRSSLEAYIGCVAGAVLLDDYLQMIRDAGFAGDLEVSTTPARQALSSDDPIVRAVREGLTEEGGGCCSSTEDLVGVAESVLSARILARKPAASSADRSAD